eukprot:gnl/MRDRNA2_/MRDRNA2_118400_c0_seq1.p1 gnl/MRDRNA2_/MRDRNA2_118400_c0~~gnl/MRDRNA2_/MRDRNA2_118400_c0_seq1.p1  ORF type:complete len:418 (-),score=93.47 gnl/MRDRNA2_/MRDRNA2_118400_c0_seq1:69-1322(-)
MPSRWVVKSQAAAKNEKYSAAKHWYHEDDLRTVPCRKVRESAKSDMVPKTQTNGPVDKEALRTVPLQEVDDSPKHDDIVVPKSSGSFDEELLRTMPFKEADDSLNSSNSTGVSDDEDAMSTSAGSSDGSLGLAESHGPSFAESEEEEQNRTPAEISRALLLAFRKNVPFAAPSKYDLRTKPIAECGPVEPEVLIPPGVFPPPGFEETFDPSQFAMFRAVVTDAEELQSLLTKISLECECLDISSTTQSAHVAQQGQVLQDWIFEKAPATAADWGTGEVKDGPYQHLWETHAEQAADVDFVSEWVTSLACTPIGMPMMSAEELSCAPASDEVKDFADFSTLFKTAWEMNAGQSLNFNMACGATKMDAASEFMAWPQGYKGLCDNWLQHGAVPQESFTWFSSPWSTFNEQWGPSCARDF